jgi:CubicO group peptidase (beta-lactamase class C family)
MIRVLIPVAASALMACGQPPSSRPAPPSYAAKLDAAVEDALAKREIPGIALVVVEGDRISYSKGFGKANLSNGEPVTDSTPWVIGSTSKPLAALAALRMVQLGKMALDTPIARYAPDLEFKDPRAAAITLRHLLTNRSGLVAGFSGPAYQRPVIQDSAAVERLARAMTALPLVFPPGQGYLYSNRGWALVGYLVQRVSGRPIEDFMRDEVFRPLGMTETTLAFWTVPNLVQGYTEGRAVRNHPHPASLTREYGPSGMVASTPRDMGRLLVAMMNQGRTVEGKQFLTPDLITEALRAQAEAESELGGPTRYALGWEVDSALGTLTIKKAGSVHSMATIWVMLPERRVAFALAFNREDYQVLPLMTNIVKALGGGEPDPFPAVPVPSFDPPKPVAVPAVRLGRWLGTYDTRFGDVRVYARGDSLWTDLDGSEVALVPTSDSTFALVDDLVGNAGKVMAFSSRPRAVVMTVGKDSLGVRLSP